MKKTSFFNLLVLICLLSYGSISAQNAQQIGFVNSNDILAVMPERIEASATLEDLNKRYKDELAVMQNDYNKKYTDFISYQTSMAESIRLRRMQELYELERNLNDFMKVAQDDVAAKEKELLDPLRLKVKTAIYDVGLEKGFICIYDLANPTIVFVTPAATDVTPLVKQKLGIKERK